MIAKKPDTLRALCMELGVPAAEILSVPYLLNRLKEIAIHVE